MMRQDEKTIISESAVRYVREQAGKIIEKFADGDKPVAENAALAIFLAGSPGAGKTEVTKDLIRILGREEKPLVPMIVRIDPDLIREEIPGYVGGNAHLFQYAATVGCDKIFNHCIKTHKHFIFDSTFADYAKAWQNIHKCSKKNRIIQIFYIYQDPLVAWEFTQARESKEGRKITKEVFCDRFFRARDTVKRIKLEFGDRIRLYALDHNLKTGYYNWHLNISAADIDKVISFHYTSDSLQKQL